MAEDQGNGIPKKSTRNADIRDQKDGILKGAPPDDRIDRVLNYPGLKYFYEKIRTGLVSGEIDIDVDSLSDSEVARILGGWASGELDDSWNARAANKLAVARLIALTGDVAGGAYFDGSQDIQIGTVVDCMSTLEIDALMESAMAIGG